MTEQGSEPLTTQLNSDTSPLMSNHSANPDIPALARENENNKLEEYMGYLNNGIKAYNEGLYSEAIAIFDNILNSSDIDSFSGYMLVPLVYHYRGLLYIALKKDVEAMKSFSKCREHIIKKREGPVEWEGVVLKGFLKEYIESLRCLSGYCLKNHELQPAEILLKFAIQIQHVAFEENETLIKLNECYGLLLMEVPSRIQESINYFKTALRLSIKIHGENDLRTAKIRIGLGNRLHEAKEYKESLIHFERALETLKKESSENTQQTSALNLKIAKCYDSMKQTDKTIQFIENYLARKGNSERAEEDIELHILLGKAYALKDSNKAISIDIAE